MLLVLFCLLMDLYVDLFVNWVYPVVRLNSMTENSSKHKNIDAILNYLRDCADAKHYLKVFEACDINMNDIEKNALITEMINFVLMSRCTFYY